MIPPDSHNRPTASPAEDRQGSDLTLNGPTSAADVDAVPELRLKPEVDSSSTLVPEHVPLERPDSVPPSAPAQPQRPHVAILFTDDADRSWLSRLFSLKAPWKKEHLGRSAYDEPVTMEVDKTPWEEHLRPSAHDEPVKLEVIGNFEKHLASPAALRDVGASIDQRLAPVEEVGGQRAGAAIDAAVHDLCSQTFDRLVRVEAAIQRTEGFVAEKPWDPSPIAHKLERVEETLRLTQTSLADSMVPELCVKIERQLGQVRMALQRTEEAVADTTLHELCRNIEARLELTEATLHRGEDLVAERLQELAARMTARFGEVEERLRLTQQSLADSTLPEVCDNIERQLIQTRTALQRSEEAVADKTLHELCQNIEARLERTEGTLRRNEGSVADWFQDFSAHMTARFATVEETIQRIERVVSGGIVEQQPSVRMDDRRVQAEDTARPADGGVLASAVLVLNRFVKIKQTNRPIQLPWMAGLAVPVLVVVAVLALIKTSGGVAPEKVVPLTTTDQISTPVVPAANQEIRPASTTTVMANAPRSTRERPVSVPERPSPNRPERPSPNRGEAPTTTQPPTFVGTLSITSVPSGASVSINGKPAGVTPLRLPRQRAGSLAVQIAHDGFERWSAAVRVPADRLTNVTAKLRATPR